LPRITNPVLQLILFLTVAFGLAYLIDGTLIIPLASYPLLVPQGVSNEASYLYWFIGLIIRMYTPFLGVVAVAKLGDIGIKKALIGYGVRGGNVEYILVAISIPYMIYGLSVLYAKIVGYPITNPLRLMPRSGLLGPIDPNILLVIVLAASALSGATINALAAFGEEIGWRGFLLHTLSLKLSFYPASIAVGVIWALWHAPLIVFMGFNYPHHPDVVGITMFILVCSVWSIILSQLRVLGESIIPPSVMHGVINAIGSLMLFTIPTIDEIYSSPVGLLGIMSSATVALIIALLMRAKGKSLRVKFYASTEDTTEDFEY